MTLDIVRRTHGRRTVLVLGLLQTLAFWWSWRQYSRLPALDAERAPRHVDEELGKVTIVIPARNEARRIGRLLTSIGSVTYPNFRVLVVDDASSDGTADLVTEAGFEVLHLARLPEGWTGKTWACWNGANQADGDWILFLDADVWLEPPALKCAVGHAMDRQVTMVSLFLRQECGSYWERLMLPFAYCLYFVGTRAQSVNRSARSALANGQFILVRRTSYLETGGHESIRGSVIDDVALARRFRSCGYPVLIARGESLGGVRMYRNLNELRAGFVKNAVQFTAVDILAGLRTVGATIVCVALAGRLFGGRNRRLAAVMLTVNAALVARWFRSFGVRPWPYALLHPLAALVFQGIALEALLRTLTHSAGWRGRRLP